MTDITELAQRMKTAAEKATQGEWWADEVKNEGCYGSGDDCVEGFTSYAIYGSDGQTLFDSLNSDAACISEEYDGEGHVAWDETAQRNAEFITLANPANVLALVEALEKAQQVDEELCKLLPPGAEYMDPPDGGDVTPLEGVRRMVADYRQRIADLESRTVSVKLLTPEVRNALKAEGLADVLKDAAEYAPLTAGQWETLTKNWYQTFIGLSGTAAGIKVEAE
ncbi:TPA: ead/Ea22-like family protein [Klebsiella pneumoniae]|uniref:ead/Ea22-like family protein n=1 Tax=Klebsiella pneumoniae TaxID=573 RepID=UPI001B32D7A4|nr:ead/Ea22-like family protein [Klebsiella pneumoniae]MBP3992250.1 ead/Ea22-like family protein [Klebsiella pneumoniae]HDZ2853924.1 ead/Ea22-like family protein [Klebsiella pneumoniae]